MTEAEILEGCRRGDRQARHELYVQTSARIQRLLVRMTKNPEAALDLVQMTYLKAFTKIGQFDGRAAVVTWLHRIAVTEALQYLRRERRNPPIATQALEYPASESHAPAADARMDIDEALALLDPLDRTLLLLRYDAGHDYRSISRIVDCAEGTVASRLHRARERLRLALKNSYSSEDNGSPEHQIVQGRKRISG